MSNISPPPDWREKLGRLGRQDIDDAERLAHMIFLREKLFPENRRTQNEEVIARLPAETVILLIEVCQRLGDWPLIIYSREEYQSRLENAAPDVKRRGKDVDNLRLLSGAYQQQGLFDEAEQCLRDALLGNYHHKTLADDYRRLRQTAKSLPAGSETLRSDALALSPLRAWHEKDFFRQYSYPEIGELCNLPDFENDDEEDWRQWLLECRGGNICLRSTIENGVLSVRSVSKYLTESAFFTTG